MTYTNEQIHVNSLPSLDSLEYQTLQKNHLISSVVSLSLFLLFMLLGLFIANYFWEEFSEFTILAFVAWFIFSLLLQIHNFLNFKSKGYALREHDIIYKEGVITQSVMAIPFNRVQHSEVNQGPIDRMLNLATLNIFTAGGSGSDLSIPGLYPTEANKLRDYIVSKTKGLDEEE